MKDGLTEDFFVINPKFLKYIKNDKTFLEREPLEKVSKLKQLSAFKHEGSGSAWIQKGINYI